MSKHNVQNPNKTNGKIISLYNFLILTLVWLVILARCTFSLYSIETFHTLDSGFMEVQKHQTQNSSFNRKHIWILTAPVSMSYISAPSDHQSTALPWPLRVRISGALQPILRHFSVCTTHKDDTQMPKIRILRCRLTEQLCSDSNA